MLTRSKSNISPEIQARNDQVIKMIASKEDINSLKVLINDQNQWIKSLHLKVVKLEEKVKETNLQIKLLGSKVNRSF